MDLLIGVHLAHVVSIFHRVKTLIRTEMTHQLFFARVSTLLVLAEDVFVGTDKVAFLAMEGIMVLAVLFHLLARLEEQGAGVVPALYSVDPMRLLHMTHKLFAVRKSQTALGVKAKQQRLLNFVSFHMILQSLAQFKCLLAHRAGVGVCIKI